MKQRQTDRAATAISPKRVPVIYVRSATDGEGQLAERLEDTRELACSRGLDVAQDDAIAEHGSGADIHRRSGIQRILQMAARGQISHLVTQDTSRLSRDYHGLRHILVSLADAGVTVITQDSGCNLGFSNDALATDLAERR